MPQRTTIASASGLIVGITATIAVTGDAPGNGALADIFMMSAWFFAMVCVTAVALTALKRWLAAHDARNRGQIDQLARERHAFVEATARRVRELNEREERLTQQAEATGSHLMSLARRLDQALTDNTQLERKLADLTEQHEDLAREYNALVRETLQERSDRFAKKPVITSTRPTAPGQRAHTPVPDHPVRTYADPDGGHHPVEPIPLRRAPSPAAQLADQPQHDRPAEGVGSQA